jgi:Astacin (Peptidase family M12A)
MLCLKRRTKMSATSSVPKSSTDVCTIKSLPQNKWISAAKQASAINPANATATYMLQQVRPDAVIPPEHLALLTAKYWGKSGVRLTVGFLDNPPQDLRARILGHMNAWNSAANANVQFVETASDPQVRIARTAGGGYWSYLGTDILSINASEQTMNLDSFTMNTIDSEFYRVVRHETGHTLGFPHEHTRSQIVDRIDREKAIAYFMASQGWSRDQVIAQVLTPLDNSALIATEDADPQSIMCYWLPASIMKDEVAVTGGTDIDEMDKQFAVSVYPKLLS